MLLVASSYANAIIKYYYKSVIVIKLELPFRNSFMIINKFGDSCLVGFNYNNLLSGVDAKMMSIISYFSFFNVYLY